MREHGVMCPGWLVFRSTQQAAVFWLEEEQSPGLETI